MSNKIIEYLSKLVEEGENVDNDILGERWALKVISFLTTTDATEERDKFVNLGGSMDLWDSHALRLGCLQGILAKAEANECPQPETDVTSESARLYHSKKHDSRKVFIVHGHDNEVKETTARFIERLGLQPVILHEQANAGRTIIEKFETYSDDIAFAVALLTPDDVGAVASDIPNLKPRARQNVILELGYFMGRLGRLRVCALHKGGVELPSDYQGVLYIEMDSSGAWKSKIAQEFVQAKLQINIEALLGG